VITSLPGCFAVIPDRFAVIADVHGNLLALDAVLADISSRGIRQIVNLGDHLQGPLDPVATAERLIPLELPSIRGNCDRLLFESGTIAPPGSTLAENRATIADQHRHWLAGMPQTLTFSEVLLCHGTPWADDVYLLEEVTPQGARLKSADEIAPMLDGLSARLILCGHSHLARSFRLPDGGQLVNPGSVGLPAYTGESPYPHAMESGSPHARYAIITRAAADWNVEHHLVDYDWQRAAQLAERNGRSDWAKWLRTGFA
jgi:predicted phosphodiesterase